MYKYYFVRISHIEKPGSKMAPCLPFIYFTVKSVLVLMLSTVSFSNCSSDANYNDCSSLYTCGRIEKIGFPFWGDEHRPAFCGLHEFRLKCDNGSHYPWIYVNSAHYDVHHINTSSHTIKVARNMNQTCSMLINEDQASIDVVAPFELTANVGNITLFYGCPSRTLSEFQPLLFQCLIVGINASVYYFNQVSDGKECLSNVTIPVNKNVVEMLNHEHARLETVMEEEFQLGYNANFSECLNCQKSGGMCGSSLSSATEFECHKPGSVKRKMIHVGLILGLGITGAIILIAIITCWHCNRLKYSHPNLESRSVSLELTEEDLEKSSISFGVPLFSFTELEEATGNFDESRQLGSGGFGIVFSGKLRDGREVAVKRLYEKSYKRVSQFMNEVQILTCLRHQNLVSLYGCTSPHCKALLLVYEYVPNGTVADHLYGNKAKLGSLSWERRMRIAIETATALSCLHSSGIIHRDVKTTNILLDGSFSVKVADFGLSRLFPTDVTHVSTAPQGTPGYLDPEYHQCYQLTVKSDVYSFGVVLIELISSLPAVDMNRQKHEINLSSYAMKRIQQGLYEELVDPRLGFGSDLRIRRMMTSMAELAFRCLQHERELRPSMDEVLEVLTRIENEPKNDGIRGSSDKTLASPTEEDDDAGLLVGSREYQANQLSPSSVMDKWSRSTATSNSSR